MSAPRSPRARERDDDEGLAPPRQPFLFVHAALWLFGALLCALWFRLRTRFRPSPFPRGALVVAANHVSYLDPLVLGLAVRRRVTFLVTSNVFDAPVYRLWMRLFGCIRVQEGATNVEAMRRALAALERGRVVGIFPEGGISDDGQLREGQLGVASLLLQGGAPVLTAAIVGTHDALPRGGGFPKRRPVEVRFSRLVTPDDLVHDLVPREARRVLRDAVMAAIAEQLPARMGGQLAESPPSR
ncbi:MAG: 1-acyl-sn-glycerol-3-phosphate acyltransferase [Planctomycetes bacterium]|nr:1-acyl-sn-glycerol-3-phosphate acyltransferase [Planctomycetota bacterium]